MDQGPTPPSPRQTLSYVRGLLQSRGIEPKNKMGQNFLIDLNLLDLIVRTAELDESDCVLEIGTGTGSLTTRLADAAGAVLTVELDPNVHALGKEVVGERPNVVLMHGDALARKNELNPDMLAAWAELARRFGCTRRKLVSNLPYVVATPVVGNLLISNEPVERLVVTVQWEIAERMTAEVGTKEYSSLAVLVQSLADVRVVRRLPPTVFWPKPKVDSAIVEIIPDAAKRARVGDPQKFRNFLRDLYTHRRKNLRQALAGWPSGRRDKHEVDAKLAELGIEGTTRAEALDREQHLRLCAAFG